MVGHRRALPTKVQTMPQNVGKVKARMPPEYRLVRRWKTLCSRRKTDDKQEIGIPNQKGGAA